MQCGQIAVSKTTRAFALGAAFAIHAAAVVTIRLLPPRTASPQRATIETVEIALEEPSAPRSEIREATAVVAPRLPSTTSAARRGGTMAGLAFATGTSFGTAAVAEGSAPTEGTSSAAPSSFDWVRPGSVDLGLDGAVRGAAILAEARAPSIDGSGAGGIVAALDAADAERGFGRGGSVRSAVEDAARGPEASILGAATFAVSVFADGGIHVDVTAARGDRTEWERLAPAVEASLAGKKLRLPPKSNGLRVTVHVDASEQFPGGARPPKKTGVVASGSGVKVVETKDRIDFELPSVTVGYQGRRCGAGLTVGATGIGVGGGCAAGVAMRVVSARILREERL